MGIFSDLKERRMYRFVAGYAAGGWVVLEIVDQFVERGILPEFIYPLTLFLYAVGFPATLTVAWYHGEKGDQKMRPVELWILGALTLVGLAGSGVILQGALSDPSLPSALTEGGSVATAPGFDPNRVAVLYFDDFSPEGELGYLADGLTESLIGELSQVDDLDVVSRNGVQQFRGSDVAVDSIVEALKVGTLVQGSVAQSADILRVNVQLVDASSGSTLESRTIEKPRGELFALQDELTVEVTGFLRQRLGEEIALREARARASSPQAWELVQRAQETARDVEPVVAGGDTRAGRRAYDRADSLLVQAVRLDPDWPRPLVVLARNAYERSRWTGTTERGEAAQLIDRGLRYAEGALSIDSTHADALEIKGTLLYWGWLLNIEPEEAARERAFREAEEALRAAVEQDPGQAGAWSILGHLLLNKGATAEAKLASRRAYEADAYLRNTDVLLWRLFSSSYDLADHQEAKHWCEEGRERFPDDPRFVECGIWLMTMEEGEAAVDSAWTLLRSYDRLIPPQQSTFRHAWGQMAVAAVIARSGLPDSARAVAEQARLGPAEDPTRDISYLEAFVRSLLGDRAEAIDLLTRYLATNPQQSSSAAETWWFEDLREMAEFQALTDASGSRGENPSE